MMKFVLLILAFNFNLFESKTATNNDNLCIPLSLETSTHNQRKRNHKPNKEPLKCSICTQRYHLNIKLHPLQKDQDDYNQNERSCRRNLDDFLKKYQEQCNKKERSLQISTFIKETNLTAFNEKKHADEAMSKQKWDNNQIRIAKQFINCELDNCNQRRMLKYVLRTDVVKQNQLEKKRETLKSRIVDVYSKAKVCDPSNLNKCYHYEPGLIDIMATSRKYSELLWAWRGWRDATGPHIRNDWICLNKIANLGAKQNGYNDTGEFWRSMYETEDFVQKIDELWDEIQPLYLQLHAYVRYKLNEMYGSKVNPTGPIPAHLLGNIWAQSWMNLYKDLKPYNDVPELDITGGLKRKNLTVVEMVHMADSFFQSLGFKPLPEKFYKNSMFTRPDDGREVVCYAASFDLKGDDDVRIKMCGQVNEDYFYTVHHEMGHIQYYRAYDDHQPPLFQDGANPGFHETVGDLAGLFVININHLTKVSVLQSVDVDQETKKKRRINFLMKKALDKITFFPFALTMAKWRWDFYADKIMDGKLNARWWQYRLDYQGLVPPVERSENDFDPGSKYHIVAQVPYIRYFVQHVLQFQMYESLCNTAEYTGNLEECDISGSNEAGQKFRDMLNKGSSENWEDVLKEMIGDCHMRSDAVLKYFEPLHGWLKSENERLGNKIGWE